MSSNPGQVELGVRGISVLSRTWTKNIWMDIIVIGFYSLDYFHKEYASDIGCY